MFSVQVIFPFLVMGRIQRGWEDSERLLLRQHERKRFREASTTSSSRRVLHAEVDKQQRLSCRLWCYERYPRRCMQFRAGWRFDSTELKYVTKFQYQKVSTYFQLSQEAIFDMFILSPPSFWGDARLDFGFPSNFTASASSLVRFSLAFLLIFSQILDGRLLLLQCYVVWFEKFPQICYSRSMGRWNLLSVFCLFGHKNGSSSLEYFFKKPYQT